MKILEFTSSCGAPVGIPAEKITGFIGLLDDNGGNCFVCTGPSGGIDDHEGWYVTATYDEVLAMLTKGGESEKKNSNTKRDNVY